MKNRKDFYDRYVSTHIASRKEIADLADFSARARTYDFHFGRFLPGANREEKKVIDLGCGNGSIVWWLQQRGFAQTVGVDVSPEQIADGHRVGVPGLVHADVKDFLDKNEARYDIIFARDVFEHIPRDEIIPLLQRVLDRLNSDGMLVLQVPNGESPFFGRIRYGDFTHELAFTRSSIQQIFGMTGFTSVECYAARPPIVGLTSLVRFIMWMFIESALRVAIFAEVGRGRKILTQNLIAIGRKGRTGQ